MARRQDFEARARALVGMRFRAQGRGPEGLDCLGLVIATYGIPGTSVRRDYRLSGEHEEEVRAGLRRFFRTMRPGEAGAGDLLLLRAGERQLHFAIKSAAGFIHAHAGLKTVVETPGAPPWPVAGAYRRRARKD